MFADSDSQNLNNAKQVLWELMKWSVRLDPNVPSDRDTTLLRIGLSLGVMVVRKYVSSNEAAAICAFCQITPTEQLLKLWDGPCPILPKSHIGE